MEAIYSSETLTSTYKITRRHNPEEQQCKQLKESVSEADAWTRTTWQERQPSAQNCSRWPWSAQLTWSRLAFNKQPQEPQNLLLINSPWQKRSQAHSGASTLARGNKNFLGLKARGKLW
jgi:hypothetical protein